MSARNKFLDDEQIQQLKPTKNRYSVSIGYNVSLWVMPSGNKIFRHRFKGLDGKYKNEVIGAFPQVTLAHARKVALIKKGKNKTLGKTFLFFAEKIIEKKVIEFEHSGKTIKYAKNRNVIRLVGLLQNHIFPTIAEKQIIDINQNDITKILNTMIKAGIIDSAYRALQIIKEILDYAKACGEVLTNVAKDAAFILPKKPQPQHHEAIVTKEKFSQLMFNVEAKKGKTTVKLALKMLAHVFLRPNELLWLKWDFIDTKQNLIKLPENYTKNGILKEIPISPQVKEILLTQFTINKNFYKCPFIFSLNGKNPISDATLRNHLNSCIANIDIKHSLHGFRASARTLIRELLKIRDDTIEFQLDHAYGDPNGTAYDRGDLLNDRVEMLNLWSDLLEQLSEDFISKKTTIYNKTEELEAW